MKGGSERYRWLIVILSILSPLTIAQQFLVRSEGYEFSFLPPIYATVNGITALLLLAAVIAIKSKRVILHRRLMKTCIVLSCCFLAMYVLYHMTSEATPYGGEGWIRNVYYVILVSHILLSVAV